MRMLSTLKLCWFVGVAEMQALAIRPPRRSSCPCCLLEMAALSSLATVASSLRAVSAEPGRIMPSRLPRHSLSALSYPVAISTGWSPSRMRPSAFFSSSPASVSTKFAPSPASLSWAAAAIAISLAAGCWTSSSETMVAASAVTKIFSRWLITILLRPVGP